MPKIKNSSPVDTVLNELVYTALFKADYEQKRRMKGKFLRVAINEKSAKRFADSSTLEDKMYVLAILGFEFYFVINKSQKALSDIKELLPILDAGKKSAASTSIAERGLFVTSEREILRSLTLVSRVTHHPSYFMDLEILRQGYHIKKWSKKYDQSKDAVHREVDESSRVVCSTILNGIMGARNSPAMVGCTESELMLLLYLYATTALEVTIDQLKDIMIGKMSVLEFKRAFRGIAYSGYISNFKGKIAIAGEGIKKVGNFFNSVIHSNSF